MTDTQSSKTPMFPQNIQKFSHPDITAKGEQRASVSLVKLETLWINTGTLCNIECANCYIESSPVNDRLAYISLEEANALFEEIEKLKLGTREIGFTGGEPFMNPDMLAMTENALKRGFEVLILTNAMKPMQRPLIKQKLLELRETYGQKLILRVSLDHFTQALHDKERGSGSWDSTLDGLNWLSEHQFHIALAGRTCWGEDEASGRKGYADLIAQEGWPIDPYSKASLVLFPEMEHQKDVPEITTACWGILNLSPSSLMCASSRMVVKRKGADCLTVLPCTLLPYDTRFEMGSSLQTSFQADDSMFSNGAVKLCHPYCAQFCVLGGGSCS